MQFNTELPKPNAVGKPEQNQIDSNKNLSSSPPGVSGDNSIYGGTNAYSAITVSSAHSQTDLVERPPRNQDLAVTNWSSGLSNFLEEPPALFPVRMIAGAAIFCLAFVGWAYLGKIEQIGKAQGKLVPEGRTYKVQPLEQGRVVKVHVKEGEKVKAGQILAELDPQLAQKEVDRLEQTLKNYQIQLSQKQSLLERVKLEAKTNSAMITAEAMAQTSSIALAQEKALTARRLLEKQQSEIAGYQARKESVNPLANAAQSALEKLQQQVEAAQERVNRLTPLATTGAISQEYVYQAQKELSEAQQRVIQAQLQDINNANENIFQANRSLQDIETRITENQGNLASAIKEVERLQAEQTQKQAQGEKLQLEATQKIKQLELEIAQLNGQIADSQNLLVSAQAKLTYNYLKAPIDGIISAFDVQNTGEVIQPGKTVAEIAPEKAPLVLSAIVPNREAGFIKKDMPVKVKLDAYPYQDYGIINGKVTSISADAKRDEKLGEVYRVEVKLDRNYVVDRQRQIVFKAGQTASADIIIRHRRIADVLLEPLEKMQKDGLKL
jgi:HlyD family secretion protein